MTIVFDCELRRPACPILQAIFGGDQGIAKSFPPETWLLVPTPGMKPYLVTQEQLQKLVQGCLDVQHNGERRTH